MIIVDYSSIVLYGTPVHLAQNLRQPLSPTFGSTYQPFAERLNDAALSAPVVMMHTPLPVESRWPTQAV